MLTITYPLLASAASHDEPFLRPGEGNRALHSERLKLSIADAAILTRLRADDTTALAELMRDHTPALLGVARLIVLDADTAQDVVQDVFIKLWDQRALVAITGTLGGYLARSVRNRAIGVLRHEQAERRAGEVQIQIALPTYSNNSSDRLDAVELSIAVRRALDDLPPRTREIFLMNRSAGLPYAAIAEMLGVAVETVHTQMYRATRKLIEAVRALG